MYIEEREPTETYTNTLNARIIVGAIQMGTFVVGSTLVRIRTRMMWIIFKHVHIVRQLIAQHLFNCWMFK